jgi:magnesium transporter
MIQTHSLGVKLGEDACLWVDLCRPDAQELDQASQQAGFRVPDRGKIGEIEFTSRVRNLGEVLFLNVPRFQEGETRGAPLGFALSRRALVTQREQPLEALAAIGRSLGERRCEGPVDLFLRIFEHLVDRLADNLEAVESELSELNRQVFDTADHVQHELRQTLLRVGALGRRLGRMHNTSMGLLRIATYLQESAPPWFDPDSPPRIKLIAKDLLSLNEFEDQLGERVEFLLDGVLGLISINQNEVMRVMAMASVVGVPPTVLVGIWGMNFANMPELSWRPGYFVALGVIMASIAVPLWWFRRRGWL